MWTFETGNNNVKDQGPNGNELCYTPWAFKGEQDTVKVPNKVAGDTYYVDAAKGDDANAGSKDKPFKTLARGAGRPCRATCCTSTRGFTANCCVSARARPTSRSRPRARRARSSAALTP